MKKILILPFHIGKDIPDANYMVENIIEELIDLISGFKNLTVLSRSISFYIKENPESLKKSIHDLNINYIIEGSVKQTSVTNLLSVRLVNATNNDIISFAKDSFGSDEWATILNEQVLFLLEENKLINHPTEIKKINGQAKQLYLKGIYHWNRYTYEEMIMAISFFKQSIKANDHYAPSYAGLANCYSVIGGMAYEEPKNAFENALKYVKKALLVNDKHSESYLCASFINLFYQYNYEQAKINLDFAFNLNKNNPRAHHLLSFYYTLCKEYDLAEKHCLKALELDPMSIPQYNMLIRINQFKKGFTKAQDYIDAAFVVNNSALPIYEVQGFNYIHTGNLESAIETFKYCLEQSNKNLVNYGYLSYTYSICDFHSESLLVERELDELHYSKNDGNYYYAKAIIKLGRKDYVGFFKHINKAVDKGVAVLFGDVLNNPIYSEIRKDYRYAELLKRGNLTKTETSIQSRKPSSVFTLKSNTKDNLLLDPQDIAFIQGDANYCTVNWYDNNLLTKTLLRVTLKQLEQQLLPFTYLIRCHKSYMINMDKKVKTVGNSKSPFIESTLFPIRVPISRNKYVEIKEMIASY